MIEVIVNGESVDMSAFSADITSLTESTFYIKIGDRHCYAELLQWDHNKRSAKMRIDGVICQLQAKNELDQTIESLGLSTVLQQSQKDIVSPMPGHILSIPVSAGQTVQKGDALLIIEAMKMENVITSQGDGVIEEICVTAGDAVNKNDLLIKLQ